MRNRQNFNLIVGRRHVVATRRRANFLPLSASSLALPFALATSTPSRDTADWPPRLSQFELISEGPRLLAGEGLRRKGAKSAHKRPISGLEVFANRNGDS